MKRAAKLAAKHYLEDVSMQVERVNHKNDFSASITKDAHREINNRQCARLENIKAQMKNSLVESKVLNAKLQQSINLKKVGDHQGNASEFTNLVLGFSEKLEDYAADLIEATVEKQRDRRMKGIISAHKQLRQLSEQYSQASLRKSRRGSISSLNSSRSGRSGYRSAKSNKS